MQPDSSGSVWCKYHYKGYRVHWKYLPRGVCFRMYKVDAEFKPAFDASCAAAAQEPDTAQAAVEQKSDVTSGVTLELYSINTWPWSWSEDSHTDTA